MISEGFCLVDKTKIYEYCLTDKTICLYNAVKERVLRMNRDILKQIIVDQKEMYRKRQVICWIENHIKKIDNYIEN